MSKFWNDSAWTLKIGVAAATLLVTGATLHCTYKKYFKKAIKRSVPTEWEEVGTISRLLIHPIKSAGPVSVASAQATFQGLASGNLFDRSFIAFNEGGEKVIGKTANLLPTLSTSFDGRKQLTITSKNLDSISIDIAELEAEAEKKILTYRLYNSRIEGVDCGDEVAQWLTNNLQMSAEDNSSRVRLLFKGNSGWKREKKLLEYYDFPNFGENDTSLYCDTSSYMIMTESSMNDLNTRLDEPVDFSFFRPCIVIEGTKPYDEDQWDFIKLGNQAVIHEVKPRQICNMTKIDPKNGRQNTKHYKVLESYRRVTSPPALAKRWKSHPIFGVHCGIDVEGDVRVGDKVYVSRRREPYWSC